MITNRKQRLINGIYNNLFSKVLSYPTASIFLNFKVDIDYTVDIIHRTISPDILSSKKVLDDLYDWFGSELDSHSIDKSNILECNLKVKITKSKFLFIPIKVYTFNLTLATDRKVLSTEKVVKGWL